MKILIAGIGNVFHGDDAFGVEVVRRLASAPLPAGVSAVDFGIRSYDLAYAIADGCDAVIFVDAASHGERPGAVSLLELDPQKLTDAVAPANGHSLNPVAVLQMVRAFGGTLGRLFLVGCQPAVLDRDDGQLELSPDVAAAVPKAVEMVRSLVKDLLEPKAQAWTDQKSGLAEAAMERR
jgi:hydrogenase maturation protease